MVGTIASASRALGRVLLQNFPAIRQGLMALLVLEMLCTYLHGSHRSVPRQSFDTFAEAKYKTASL